MIPASFRDSHCNLGLELGKQNPVGGIFHWGPYSIFAPEHGDKTI